MGGFWGRNRLYESFLESSRGMGSYWGDLSGGEVQIFRNP